MRTTSFPSFEVDIAIGKRDYMRAIAALRSELKGTAEDAHTLSLIAHCHHWMGQGQEAVDVAGQALQFDRNCYRAHRLLAHLHFERKEFSHAAHHVQLAVENHHPLPRIPALARWAVITAVFARRGLAAARLEHARLISLPSSDTEWLDWAQKYVSWFNAQGCQSATSGSPTAGEP